MIFRIRPFDRRDRERPHRAEGNFGRKALGTRPPDTVIPELSDIFLLRAETWAMIISDDELDHREPPDRADDLVSDRAPRFATRTGTRRLGEKNFV